MLIEHLNHLVNVAGIEHVGLGFDIAQMILPDAYITVNGIKQKVVDIVASHGDIPEFTEELLKHGYTEDMPIICLLFPNEIVGANKNIDGIEIVDNCYFPVATWTLNQ